MCNYQLNPQRIGGMDRFFVAFDIACKKKGFIVDWFFLDSDKHSFYFNLGVISGSGTIEDIFHKYLLTKAQPYDFVITHFLDLCTPFYQKIKETGIGYVIAVDHNPRPLKGFPLIKKLKNKIKGRVYGQFIDCFVGVSQYTVDSILEDYGSHLRQKTRVIYNGIDTPIYLKKTEKNYKKFIIASHLRESKGIQDLIEAVNLLPLKIKEIISVDIYGEGPLENYLKKKIYSYDLQKTIKLKGSSPDLHLKYKNYSFLLQPTYMECFSLSILESLAANVPVITTPVGGNLEIISEGINGFIFSPGDIKTLSELLEKVVLQKVAIINNVNSEIEQNFDLQQMVKNHINLLKCT